MAVVGVSLPSTATVGHGDGRSKASLGMRALSVLGFFMMAGGIAALVVTRTLVSHSLAAISLQVVAVALLVWARRAFGRRSFHLRADPTDGGLVTTGPYRLIRHPIYTAVCLFVWASALGSPSVRTVVIALVVTTGAVVRIVCEEHLLVQRYPEYLAYSRETKRMVPFIF